MTIGNPIPHNAISILRQRGGNDVDLVRNIAARLAPMASENTKERVYILISCLADLLYWTANEKVCDGADIERREYLIFAIEGALHAAIYPSADSAEDNQ